MYTQQKNWIVSAIGIALFAFSLSFTGCADESTPRNPTSPPSSQGSDDVVVKPQRLYNLAELQSEVPLTDSQITWLTNSSEFARMSEWASSQSYTLATDECVLLTYDRPGVRIANIPLYTTDGIPVWGAVSIMLPFTHQAEGMAYVVFSSPESPSIVFYGGSGAEVHNTYDSKGMLRNSVSIGSSFGCGKTWKKFEEWLNSPDDPANLPWWLDILCGGACFDAIFGTHNPWSISGCIHCLGAYAAGCIEIEAAPVSPQKYQFQN